MMEEAGKAASPQTVRDLNEVRNAFLSLHTLLLGLERAAYESEFGATSSGEMLKLVIGDERFAWLRRISELIVRIDVLLDEEDPVTESSARTVIDYSVEMITPTENGSPFQQRYLMAMQNEPDVIFAHRSTQQILARARANLK
jgi:hypothetical protein